MVRLMLSPTSEVLMAKSKTNSSVRSAKTPKFGAKRAANRAANARSGATKHARILSMLQSRSGATIAAMVRVTGWQQHSIRGFLAGVVKKKLGLDLTSEKNKSERIYRIQAPKRPANSSAAATERV
jgi:hypothetical protein